MTDGCLMPTVPTLCAIATLVTVCFSFTCTHSSCMQHEVSKHEHGSSWSVIVMPCICPSKKYDQARHSALVGQWHLYHAEPSCMIVDLPLVS